MMLFSSPPLKVTTLSLSDDFTWVQGLLLLLQEPQRGLSETLLGQVVDIQVWDGWWLPGQAPSAAPGPNTRYSNIERHARYVVQFPCGFQIGERVPRYLYFITDSLSVMFFRADLAYIQISPRCCKRTRVHLVSCCPPKSGVRNCLKHNSSCQTRSQNHTSEGHRDIRGERILKKDVPVM